MNATIMDKLVLTEAGADMAAKAVEAEAQARGVAPVIAVVDEHGTLITSAVRTMPRSPASMWRSTSSAQLQRQAAQQPERPGVSARMAHATFHRPAIWAARGVRGSAQHRSCRSAACSLPLKDGEITLLTDEAERPEPVLRLRRDERYLYVGNWELRKKKVVMRYEVNADGPRLGVARCSTRTWPTPPGEDAIDGVKVDQAGNLYVCGPGGIWVLSPNGKHLGTIKTT